MTPSQFDEIMILLKTLGLIAGGVVAITKFFEYLKTKAKEKSLGETKVKELEKRLSDFGGCIEELTKGRKDDQGTIKRLQDDYDLLKRYIWDLLGKR